MVMIQGRNTVRKSFLRVKERWDHRATKVKSQFKRKFHNKNRQSLLQKLTFLR